MARMHVPSVVLAFVFSFVLMSVKADTTLKNIALHKPTSQSSRRGAGGSSHAVDGNTNNRFYAGSCTHTSHRVTLEEEFDPWWTVDLLGQFKITHVHILNRGDCCQERLHDVKIDVLTENSGIHKGRLCCIHRGPAKLRWLNLTCNKPVTGRYVRITKLQFGPTDVLTLCEVQVFGTVHERADRLLHISRGNLTAGSLQSLKERAQLVIDCLRKLTCKGFYMELSTGSHICPKH